MNDVMNVFESVSKMYVINQSEIYVHRMRVSMSIKLNENFISIARNPFDLHVFMYVVDVEFCNAIDSAIQCNKLPVPIFVGKQSLNGGK